MIDKVDKLCMSCGACYNACPVDAIKMDYNAKGFYIPYVDENICIECSKCIKVCAAIEYKSNNKKPIVYAVAAEDSERIKSTSGGVFPVLAKYVLSNDGFVCGVAWNEKYEAEHIIIDNEQELDRLRISKYVQSNTNNVFKEIQRLLKNNKQVLFSGTPCQVAGLTKFLGKEYDNLITMDVICHGNPPQKLWQEYLKSNYDVRNISEINFRVKYDDWNKGTCAAAIYNTNYGYILENSVKKEIGIFYQAFLEHRISNDACMECKYKFIPRPADFTAGDFWFFKNNKKYDSKKGLSVMCVNSFKAQRVFKDISQQFKICDEVNLKDKWWKIEINNINKDSRERTEFFNKYKKERNINSILNEAIGKKYDIALITMFNIMNYGSALVAYAVNRMLENLGYTILMIDKDINGVDYNKSDNRSMQFARKRYNISRFYKNNESSFDLNEIVDTFVVGSDTMWWDTEWANDYAYLDFVESSKRKIAFATSFGHETPAMNYESQVRRRYLFNRFNFISTREDAGVRILDEIFGVKAVSFYDPTLIIEKEIFDDLAKDSERKDSDFVFAYMLDLTPEKEKAAKYVADKLGIKLKLISNMRYKGKSKYIDEYNISIEDFVYYCKNAKFIITDSFHGVCFSIIYEIPFIGIINEMRGVSRYKIFDEMMLTNQLVNLTEKVYEYKDLNFKIDFTTAKEKIKEERLKVYEWLNNALNTPLDKVDKNDVLYDYIYQKNISSNHSLFRKFLGQ